MSGERHKKVMLSLGMAGGIVPTYRERAPKITPETSKMLNVVEHTVNSAIAFFGGLGKNNLEQVGIVIDKASADPNILGRARSIITFIDYSIWLLESQLSGDKPPGNIKGNAGKIKIKRVIDALVNLRLSIAGNRNYDMSSIAGIKAAERFMEICPISINAPSAEMTT